MTKQYNSPTVEIVHFHAWEDMATTPEEVEANRNQNQRAGDGGDVGNPSFGEGVDDW